MAYPSSASVFRPFSNVPQTPPVTQPVPPATSASTSWLGILIAVGVLGFVIWKSTH